VAGAGSHIITGFSLFTLKVVLSGRGDEIIGQEPNNIDSAKSRPYDRGTAKVHHKKVFRQLFLWLPDKRGFTPENHHVC
jgi:hypothetical protein